MKLPWLLFSLLACSSAAPAPAPAPAPAVVSAHTTSAAHLPRVTTPHWNAALVHKGSNPHNNSAIGTKRTGTAAGTGTAPTGSTPYKSIVTNDMNGAVIGCTAVAEASKNEIGYGQTYTSGSYYCNGGPTLSIDVAAINTSLSGHAPVSSSTQGNQSTYSYPATGCTYATFPATTHGPVVTYCACAGGDMAATNILVSKTAVTTVCATASSIPDGWTAVPNGPQADPWFQNVTGPVDGVDCSVYPSGAFVPNSQCWDQLNLTSYATWWWQSFNSSCNGLPFGDCFYALQTGYAPSNCSQATTNQECTQPAYQDFQNHWNGARNFYIAMNIWNMATFFDRYSQALSDAQTSATDGIAALNNQINPVQTTNNQLTELLVAAGIGLAFISAGEEAFLGLAEALTAAQQVPGLLRYLIPQGTTSAQQALDYANATETLALLAQDWQTSVSSGLKLILTNASTFVPMGESAQFSASQPATSQLAQGLTQGMLTYTAAQMYINKGMVIVRAPDTDPHALQTNGSNLRWTLDACENGYDKNGVCGEFWYSTANGTAYALTDPNNQQTSFNQDYGVIFNNLTSGDLLFLGADNCARMSGNNTNKPAPTFINANAGTAGSYCLSNLPVCTWNTVWNLDNTYKHVVNDCTYGGSGTTLGEATMDVSTVNPYGDPVDYCQVPIQYLGYGIYLKGADWDNQMIDYPWQQIG